MAPRAKTGASPTPPERKRDAGENLTKKAKFPADAAPRKTAAPDLDAELDAALAQTFPASDPISLESTLVPGGRR